MCVSYRLPFIELPDPYSVKTINHKLLQLFSFPLGLYIGRVIYFVCSTWDVCILFLSVTEYLSEIQTNVFRSVMMSNLLVVAGQEIISRPLCHVAW